MNKAVFLDRDGTINVDKNYLYKVEDFEFLPGAIDALKYFKKKGFLLILITNQSGIARGYYTVDDMNALHEYMQQELKRNGADIDAIYYCPHLEDGIIPQYAAPCNCRKPATGLFLKAIEEFDIDVNNSIAIGDKRRDIDPIISLGGRGFLLDSNDGWEKIIREFESMRKTE